MVAVPEKHSPALYKASLINIINSQTQKNNEKDIQIEKENTAPLVEDIITEDLENIPDITEQE